MPRMTAVLTGIILDEDYSTSKKPAAVDQIPQYQGKQIASFGQRIEFIGGYMIAMIVMIAVLFMACFYFFNKIRCTVITV